MLMAVKYIQTIEVTLRQLWKWLEYSKCCSAFVKVCVSLQKIKLAYANDDPTKQKKLLKSLAVKYRKLAGQGGFQLAKVFQASAQTFCPWTPLEAHTLKALAVHPLPTLKIWLTTSKSMENTGCTLYVVAKTKSLHRAISETS